MWRMIFLILVVLGALAVLLAVMLGIGVAKVAMVQAADGTSAPASGPTAIAAGTHPVMPLTAAPQPAAPGPDVPVPAPPAPNVVGNPPVVPADAPKVEPPQAFVPGTIVLSGAQAKLHARTLCKTPLGDLSSWTRPEDYASWIFTPPEGQYRVFITHATGEDAGGEYGLVLSESKKTPPHFEARATPTGGWDKFRTDFVGVLDLKDKRTTLAIRPTGDFDSALMRLRRIELVPLEPLQAPDDPDLPIEIIGLTLVEAETGKSLSLLTNLMVLDLTSLPPFSIRVDTAGPVGSVRFSIDKKEQPPESLKPFSIAGDADGKYTPWRPAPGRYTLIVTPYPEPDAGGKAGKRRTYSIRIASLAPIVLSAKEATLHGNLRLEHAGVPTIVSWSREDDWVEWSVPAPENGQYEVELLYSCAKGNGGEFVFRAGNARVTEDAESTNGWDTYERRKIGVVKLSRGKNIVTIKPNDVNDKKMLMNLREVRLVPVVEHGGG